MKAKDVHAMGRVIDIMTHFKESKRRSREEKLVSHIGTHSDASGDSNDLDATTSEDLHKHIGPVGSDR